MEKEISVNANIIEFIPSIRMILSDKCLKIVRLQSKTFTMPFCNDLIMLEKAVSTYKPSESALWDGKFLFLNQSSSPEIILKSFIHELNIFKSVNSTQPKVIFIKDYGILASEDHSHAVSQLHEEVESCLLHFLNQSKKGISELEVQQENHAKYEYTNAFPGILNQKICVVTGGAQGFGEGISRSLVCDHANLIIADLNVEKGLSTCKELSALCGANEVSFIKTDVSNPDSVKNLIFSVVKHFGGIDLFISNAGILKAGGLEEMDPASFELMTKINYEGYFLCAKYASAVMKNQTLQKEDYFADIIQINSKSGLKGSNRNFAYSGGKFGGIGLTQSFALELAPSRIKVNAICPGNFFEGPLWADPEKGLFVQYLKAGKVAGAKTIEDVRRYYENQVPLGRGCQVKDIMKAIYYVVSQEYETGQAIPVTGGQEMVN